MKNNKIKRISALLGCVLVLLSVVILPAFAQPIVGDDNGVSTVYVYNQFVDYINAYDDASFNNYINTLDEFDNGKGYGYEGYIMGLDYLAFGYVDPDLIEYPFDELGIDIRMSGHLDFSMAVNDLTFSAIGASVDLHSVPTANAIVLVITDYSSSGNGREYYIGYQGYDAPPDSTDRALYYGRIVDIEVIDVVNGERTQYVRLVRDEIEYLSFTFSNGLYDDTGLLTTIGMLFFGDYTGNHYSPNDFYNGFADGNAHYESAVNIAYQEGYQDAVSEIDSGSFGKNILGSVFSAPFDMLNDFKLIEWKLDNGSLISVSLGTVVSAGIGVSLFIWLLKVFRGG